MTIVVSMYSLEDTYICEHPNCQQCKEYRYQWDRKLNKLIQSKTPRVEFHKLKRVTEAERVSIKSTIDSAIQLAEDADAMQQEPIIKTLYVSALVLRKSLEQN